jgi:Ca2+-binding RTX toxin-like protein
MEGNDRIEGGAGNDTLFAGAGFDIMLGGDGDDSFYKAGVGSGRLKGGNGNDSFEVNPFTEADTLLLDGGAGADSFLIWAGGSSTITVDGGSGNDRIVFRAATGSITVKGGAGIDTLVLSGESSYSSAIVVQDFITGPLGERLDLGNYLSSAPIGWDGSSNPFSAGYFRLTQSGNATLLEVDMDGQDFNYDFMTLFEFQNTLATDFTSENLGGFSLTPVITGTDGADRVVGNSSAERLEGLKGNDVLLGRGGDDLLLGEIGNDRLYGGSGGDRLYGGAGADRLAGGAGADRLIGGHGQDRFVFSTELGTGNVDSILDFSAAADSIQLAQSIFDAAGPTGTLSADAFHAGAAAGDASDRIIYDTSSGEIFYDPDGTGAAEAILFATVDPGTMVTNLDFSVYTG